MPVSTTIAEGRINETLNDLSMPVGFDVPSLDPRITSEVCVPLNCFTVGSLRVRRDQMVEIGGEALPLSKFADMVRSFVAGGNAQSEADPRQVIVSLLSQAELQEDGRYSFPAAEEFLRPRKFGHRVIVENPVADNANLHSIFLKHEVRGSNGAVINDPVYVTPEHFPNIAALVVLLTPMTGEAHPLTELVEDMKRFKQSGKLAAA